MLRTQLYDDPRGRFLHDLVLDSCRRYGNKTALVDASSGRRLTYSEYGETVEAIARGLIAAGVQPGDVVAIFLANSWEFCASFHAAQLAGAIPTLLNPTYREREVRYQLENSGAVVLITDGGSIAGMNLGGLPGLRRVYTTRQAAAGSESFAELLQPRSGRYANPGLSSDQTIAALPYSSGTTGLPKGVMLSHLNLVANIYQLLGPNATQLGAGDNILCCLPLYHIYGLNVVLNPALLLGATLIVTPRFNLQQLASLIVNEGVTMMPLVPPAILAICQAAEAGQFPRDHSVRWVKSGAAPLAPDLPRRFTELTRILVCQGYGMTEASPVTHVGFLDGARYLPDSIGHPLAQTDCRVIASCILDLSGSQEDATEVASGQPGELVMRGPQFMLGYWK